MIWNTPSTYSSYCSKQNRMFFSPFLDQHIDLASCTGVFFETLPRHKLLNKCSMASNSAIGDREKRSMLLSCIRFLCILDSHQEAGSPCRERRCRICEFLDFLVHKFDYR